MFSLHATVNIFVQCLAYTYGFLLTTKLWPCLCCKVVTAVAEKLSTPVTRLVILMAPSGYTRYSLAAAVALQHPSKLPFYISLRGMFGESMVGEQLLYQLHGSFPCVPSTDQLYGHLKLLGCSLHDRLLLILDEVDFAVTHDEGTFMQQLLGKLLWLLPKAQLLLTCSCAFDPDEEESLITSDGSCTSYELPDSSLKVSCYQFCRLDYRDYCCK